MSKEKNTKKNIDTLSKVVDQLAKDFGMEGVIIMWDRDMNKVYGCTSPDLTLEQTKDLLVQLLQQIVDPNVSWDWKSIEV